MFPASMLGKAGVTDRQGAELGKAVDAMVGARTGKISYVIVSKGGVAGVGESFRQLPWAEARMVGETIEASIDASHFERMPTVERDEWPAR
jgi:sporulation protein YlmC with PRC-barrel domain